MTVSERIPFSGFLLPLQEGYTYSYDRRTTNGMELLFIFREDGHSRYYFESDMQEFDRKAASNTHSLTVYPRPNGDGEVSLLHRKRAATDRFFLFRMTKPGVTLTGEMCLWEDETPITELMNEKQRLTVQLEQYAAMRQKRESAKSRLDEIYTILDGLQNHPMEYDDKLVRQIIECVVVESKEKIKVVFIGGTEIEMTL